MRRTWVGYTLPEVLLAMLLMGLVAVGVGKLLSLSSVTARGERHRLQATLIATSELGRLRAAGPAAMSAADTFRVDKYGGVDPAGVYQVEVDARSYCRGGVEPRDNMLSPNPYGSGCGSSRAIGGLQVTVRYPRGGVPLGGMVQYHLLLGPSSRNAGVLGER